MEKILIVEDNVQSLFALKDSLGERGFFVDTAEDGNIGSEKAKNNTYDIIILDLGLPYKSGQDICAEIRQRGNDVPIIVLSATFDSDTKVELLMMGANDYITKPFTFKELHARIIVKLRDRKKDALILSACGFTLNADSQTIKCGAKNVPLTHQEYQLLNFLLMNKGKVCLKTEILEKVWGEQPDSNTKTLESHIWKLRKKLKQRRKKPSFAQNRTAISLKKDEQEICG
ncbi:MAG: response regulator transcription factor [Candidatus Paceibacterota bacterium]